MLGVVATLLEREGVGLGKPVGEAVTLGSAV